MPPKHIGVIKKNEKEVGKMVSKTAGKKTAKKK